MSEEAVAFLRHVACAGLEPLDCARDRRQRRSQLVGGVVDELALGAPAPLALRDVCDDEEHGVEATGRNPCHVEDTLAVLAYDLRLEASVRCEEIGDEAAERKHR